MRTDAEKLKQDTRDAKEDKERMEIKLIDAQERLKVLETEKTKFEGNFFQIMGPITRTSIVICKSEYKSILRQVIRNSWSNKNRR